MYVSPEMLQDNVSKPAGDLWALGCILFKMLSGTYPFEGSTENLTFTKIVERDFVMPENISAEAKDLIDKLLQLDPEQRIGTGPDGFNNLKAHPFFKGIDFTKITTTPPPID